MYTIELGGKIIFDPINLTNKHDLQSTWKRIVIVEFDGDICEYYQWFIKKRYNLVLNKPVRNAHVTLVNDSLNDLTKGGKLLIGEVNMIWNDNKQKYNSKEVIITLNVDVRTNGETWWMNLSDECEQVLHNIRAELGLGIPYFKLHMTIGNAHPKYEEHSKYIHNLIVNGFV